MGKKSRLKKEKRERQFQEEISDPVKREVRSFLIRQGVDPDQGGQLSYLILTLVNFSIYHFIKERTQLPPIRPDEEKRDEARLKSLHVALEAECLSLGIDYQIVVNELVTGLGTNETLVSQILQKVYGLMDSLTSSKSFDDMTDGQIENPDTWGDSLVQYEERKEDYVEAIKALFDFNLSVVRSDVQNSEQIMPVLDPSEIREKYSIPPGEFDKLVRRATEFLRAAFANYLEMEFHGVRLALDARETMGEIDAKGAMQN